MKISPPKPELVQQHGEWEVYTVMSESEPPLKHVVAVKYGLAPVQNEDNGIPSLVIPVDWICSCKGFCYKKFCWHVSTLGCEE